MDQVSRRIIVTGANRGLGLEFVRLWLQAGHEVFALARRPEASTQLQELKKQYSKQLHLAACEVTDPTSVRQAREKVQASWDRVDILLNNAGIYGDRPSQRSLESIGLEMMREVLEVNCLGALTVTQEFLPLLRNGEKAKLVQMTSLMGSIGDNGGGGSYAYRTSKAALNMLGKTMSIELAPQGITTMVLHPGWVKTDMGGTSAPLEVTDAVSAMIRTIEGLQPNQNGTFLDRDGQELPW